MHNTYHRWRTSLLPPSFRVRVDAWNAAGPGRASHTSSWFFGKTALKEIMEVSSMPHDQLWHPNPCPFCGNPVHPGGSIIRHAIYCSQPYDTARGLYHAALFCHRYVLWMLHGDRKNYKFTKTRCFHSTAREVSTICKAIKSSNTFRYKGNSSNERQITQGERRVKQLALLSVNE